MNEFAYEHTPIEGLDYEYMDELKIVPTVIKLTSNTYEDIMIQFGRVKIEEDLGYARVSFQYKFYGNQNIDEENLRNNPRFNEWLGAILKDVMENTLQKDNNE